MSTPVQTAPKRLTDDQVSELLELEAKASGGPWTVLDDSCRKCTVGEFDIPECETGNHGMFLGRDNPDFIVASRNYLRSLLLEIQRTRIFLEKLSKHEDPEGDYEQSSDYGQHYEAGYDQALANLARQARELLSASQSVGEEK